MKELRDFNWTECSREPTLPSGSCHRCFRTAGTLLWIEFLELPIQKVWKKWVTPIAWVILTGLGSRWRFPLWLEELVAWLYFVQLSELRCGVSGAGEGTMLKTHMYAKILVIQETVCCSSRTSTSFQEGRNPGFLWFGTVLITSSTFPCIQLCTSS